MPVHPFRCVYAKCWIPQRYILCGMAFLGLVNAYSMRTCLNITLTEMVTPQKAPETSALSGQQCPGNMSLSIRVQGGTYNWTESEQQIILGLFFYGYVITHIPGGWMSDVLGGRHVLSQSVLISGLLIILTPLFIDHGGWKLLAASRFFVGLAQGVLFPSITTLLAKWVPKKERGLWVSFVMTGTQIGSITGNLLSSFLMATLGNWRAVYYFWAASGILWYVFFMFMCFSEPAAHPFITAKEAEMLADEIGETDKLNIPWKRIVCYPPCLAMMAGAIGHGYVFFLIVTELPKYMKDVLKFNIQENGMLNAFPYLALWFSSILTGYIADKLVAKEILRATAIRKLYTTIASVGPSVCVVVAGYLGCNRIAAACMFVLGMFSMGPYYPGLRVNILDVTKNFAGILSAFVNGIGALAFAPIPSIIGEMAKDHTVERWRQIFWIIFVVCTITNIVYVVWASAERAEWDKVDQRAAVR